MEHDTPFGNSNRENGPTVLDFPLFLGIFQWDEPTKRVPFTAQPEIPEILTKWKATIVTASSLLPFFGTRLRRQNFNLAPTQYRQLRRLMAATTDGCRYSAYFYACGCSSTNKYSCATTNTVTGFKIFKKVLTKIWELDCVLQFSRNVFVTVPVN